MKQPETSVVLAGVDGRTDARLPEWYAQRKSESDPVSFAKAIRDLSRAVETTVAYSNPYTNEWIETERFNAIVEPFRLHDQTRGERSNLSDAHSDRTPDLSMCKFYTR